MNKIILAFTCLLIIHSKALELNNVDPIKKTISSSKTISYLKWDLLMSGDQVVVFINDKSKHIFIKVCYKRELKNLKFVGFEIGANEIYQHYVPSHLLGNDFHKLMKIIANIDVESLSDDSKRSHLTYLINKYKLFEKSCGVMPK